MSSEVQKFIPPSILKKLERTDNITHFFVAHKIPNSGESAKNVAQGALKSLLYTILTLGIIKVNVSVNSATEYQYYFLTDNNEVFRVKYHAKQVNLTSSMGGDADAKIFDAEKINIEQFKNFTYTNLVTKVTLGNESISFAMTPPNALNDSGSGKTSVMGKYVNMVTSKADQEEALAFAKHSVGFIQAVAHHNGLNLSNDFS